MFGNSQDAERYAARIWYTTDTLAESESTVLFVGSNHKGRKEVLLE